jgi:hypothetical protein
VLPETVLQIIRLSLELTLEIVKGIPVEQRQAWWVENQRRIAVWEALLARLSPDVPKA